jgi:TRAP-type C4-dicarboxylate transport system permease small subunit
MEGYRFVIRAFAWVAALLLGAMAVLVSVDVVVRNLGLGTVAWVVEVSEYTLPVATLLVAPWLLHRNEHVRLDALVTAVPRRLALVLERCTDILGMLICAVFILFSVKLIVDSARLGSMMVKTLEVPEWWQYALIPVCFLLLAVEFARRLRASALPPREVPKA